ncbi:penicillin-binding transpeptidase domain-containing protein [Streptodolium elevatio]|uniref:Penicillin-binding transpeptidase domain-containing protein n=1 Tax=Streptodolium elevatio TaxID=3157996 RepID=A0ABV3DHK8_9ACTN
MGRTRRRIPSAVPVALSVVVALALTGCSDDGGKKDTSEATAKEFLAAWQANDIPKAAALTDDPAKATAALNDARKQLQLRQGEYAAKGYTKGEDDKPGSLAYSAKLTVAGVPEPLTIESAVPVVNKDGKAVVHWEAKILHPQFEEGWKFSNVRKSPDRASILDRNGGNLAGAMPAVSISLWPSKMGANADAIYAALSDPVFDKDIPKLKDQVAKSNPENAVFVVNLSKDKFDRIAKPKLERFGPAIVIKDITLQTSTVAKQIVGQVGEATDEILQKPGYENAGAGDQVGTSGLQARYQAQLGGTPTTKVTVKNGSGAEVATLYEKGGTPGTPIKTTLDQKMQTEAEKVMAASDKNASIVAIDTKTGGILAAANNPANGNNSAFNGRYAPGSTFKTVTAAALLQSGLKPTDKAPCENTLVVNGQTFKNYDDLKPIPDATFGADFMQSCNTGFIAQSDRLQDDTLTKVASDVFGVGQQWDVGTTTFDGSVPPAASKNEKAASMIGQGKVQASPLVMASVAATVESGTFNQPVIVTDPAPPARAASKPVDPAIAGQLRALMQSVVAGGTAESLKGVAEGAKTGTAEFSEGGQVLTNGWMIAFKGDIAVAVIVEKGESGGKAAGPIVKAFLSAV